MSDSKDTVPTYSERYYDDLYEYRHVVMPPAMAQKLPKPMRLLTEWEWRSLGVQQSPGWVHYAVHRPEPHVLLFRRPKFYGTPQEVKIASAHPENIPVN